MKRNLLFLCMFAMWCFAVLGSGKIFTNSSAQQADIELSLAPLSIPDNTIGIRVRGASKNGKRLVFESENNFNGGNPDRNPEIFVFDVDSQSIIQITNSQNGTTPIVFVKNLTPSISGDGTKIVFSSNAPLGDMLDTDHNYEMYLANLPPGATTATISRLTKTDPDFFCGNVGPSVNDDGSMIVFVSRCKSFNETNVAGSFTPDNPEGNPEIMALRLDPGQTRYRYIQVTGTQNYNQCGATCSSHTPRVSGNGMVVAFLSYGDFEGRNGDANGDFENEEIFLSRYDLGSSRFANIIQVTDTIENNGVGGIVPIFDVMTGKFRVDNNRARGNLFQWIMNPLSNDGRWLVMESAGNYDGINHNKARNVWLFDTVNRSFIRLTNQMASPVPTQDELRQLDYFFFPSINAAGTFITFSSSLNLTSQNPDGSKEVFRYEINHGSLRQLTFTQPSSFYDDERDNYTSSFLSANGDIVSFNYLTQSLQPNAENVIGLFQMIIRPVTRSSPGARIVNGASFDPAQVARGSLSTVQGNELANSTPSVPASPPFIVDGVSVSVGGIAARITYVSPGRVNFVVPNEIATGDAVAFSVNNNGVQSAGTIKIVDAAPGIYSVDGSGTGMPTATCLSKFQGFHDIYYDPPCVASGANLDSILFFFGTGWRNALGTQVKLNGMTLTPVYSGAAGGGDRRDQINLVVPSNLAGLTDADISVVASGINLESNKLKVSFQEISTALLLLDSSRCLTKRPGMPDEYSYPPCTVSSDTTTGILVLYGTVFSNAPSLQVKFEEVTLSPVYSGPSGNNPAIDQMNIPLPPSLAGRTGHISVIIPGTGVESNKVSISFQPLP